MVAVTSHPDRDDPRDDPHDQDQSGDWDEPIDPMRSVEHTFPGPALTPPLNRFAPPKAKPFEPSPDLEPHIFQKLANPDCSLTYLAKELDTTVDALSLWMARPDVMEKCRTIVSAGMMQTKMVVSTRLNMCVKGLMTIVACGVNVDANTPMPISYHDRKLREYQRHNVIRAIALVLRCGRFDPFAPTRAPRPHNDSPDNTRPPSGPRINETLDGKPPNWTAYHAAIRQHDADVAATKHTPQPIESAHAAHAAPTRNNASTTDGEPASTTEPAPDALTTRVPPVPGSDAQRPEPELVPPSSSPWPPPTPSSSPWPSAALRVESSPALSPRSIPHASIRPRSRDSPAD